MVEERFTYPLPITSKRYLTELGGRSDLLEEGRIGLRAEALLSNTELEPGDGVLLDSAGKNKDAMASPPTPLYKREVYQVRPLTDLDDSRLLAMTGEGEAVLSSNDSLDLELGEEVVINASINRLPKNWIDRVINDKAHFAMK